jgi:hypothetical protein
LQLLCHPGKRAAIVLKKKTVLAGAFIRGLGFCVSEKNGFLQPDTIINLYSYAVRSTYHLRKAQAPDKRAGKDSFLFKNNGGAFSGVTQQLQIWDKVR